MCIYVCVYECVCVIMGTDAHDHSTARVPSLYQLACSALRAMPQVQLHDPASAHANLNLMSNIHKPCRGNLENMPFLIDKREGLVRRQKEGTGHQALTDDTKSANMMDTCPDEIEHHFVPDSDRYDWYSKVKDGHPGLCRTDMPQVRHHGYRRDGLLWRRRVR